MKTVKNEKKKKTNNVSYVQEVREALRVGTFTLKDILDALNEKECKKMFKKWRKSQNSNDALMPSAGRTDPEQPFSDTSSSLSEIEEGDENDVLNEGMNLADLSSTIRSRMNDELEYSTDRSIVRKVDQHFEKRVDPFGDKGKIIGPKNPAGNPVARAPIGMKPAQTIDQLPKALVDQMNKTSYNEKLESRKKMLRNEGLLHEKLDPPKPTQDDFAHRIFLEEDYKRELVDATRRELKMPEPNMINPENGECDQGWRDWFENRMQQIREWLIEDATIYSHLRPSCECDPPKGLNKMAADWHTLRKNEVQIKWDYEEYGAMMLSDTMAYD